MDLVEISPTAQPPVCRIMNYGKYLYQLNKKAHEAKKHQKVIQVKEAKFRPMTDDHDYEFKKNNIIRFLGEGDRVKAGEMFRGREDSHCEIGRQRITRRMQAVADHVLSEGLPKMEVNSMFAVVGP